jgi:Ca-activated chloride channel homolog
MRGASPITSLVICLFVSFISHAQSTHDFVLCNAVDKSGGHPAAVDSLKFSVEVHGRTVSNAHAEQRQRSRRIFLVQDVSASMRGSNARQPSMQAVRDFLAASPEDKVALVDFNDNYYLDISPENAAAFLEKYNDTEFQQGLRFFGGTALFDAVVASASYLEKEPQEGDSIVVISDGADDASKMSSEQMERELLRSKIRLYLLLLAPPKHPNPNDGRSRSQLMDAVRDTGGVVVKTDSGNVPSRHWAEAMHSLIEVADRVDFDLNTPLGSPARLDVLASTPDGKRDKAVEISCPRYVSPQ